MEEENGETTNFKFYLHSTKDGKYRVFSSVSPENFIID